MCSLCCNSGSTGSVVVIVAVIVAVIVGLHCSQWSVAAEIDVWPGVGGVSLGVRVQRWVGVVVVVGVVLFLREEDVAEPVAHGLRECGAGCLQGQEGPRPHCTHTEKKQARATV